MKLIKFVVSSVVLISAFGLFSSVNCAVIISKADTFSCITCTTGDKLDLCYISGPEINEKSEQCDSTVCYTFLGKIMALMC